jgi:hypothetical protein
MLEIHIAPRRREFIRHRRTPQSFALRDRWPTRLLALCIKASSRLHSPPTARDKIPEGGGSGVWLWSECPERTAATFKQVARRDKENAMDCGSDASTIPEGEKLFLAPDDSFPEFDWTYRIGRSRTGLTDWR